jgi:hypothetical protein
MRGSGSIRGAVLALCCAVSAPSIVAAQEPFNLAVPVEHAATLFTNLFGPRGLVVDSEATLPGEQSHSAHFNSDFQGNFSQFGTALVSQLVTVPLPSPASGFTYEFDQTTGVFQRSTSSFGPILAERAETVGAGHTSLGFAMQRFTFDSIEDLDLANVPAVFTHDNAVLLGGRQDVVTTVNTITARVTQSAAFFTLGVTDRLDVSVAVPIVSTSVSVVSHAQIRRLGTTNPLTHFFRAVGGEIGDRRLFTARASASGIGDVTVRVKNNFRATDSSGLAVGVDVRVPTGDAMELLGTGAVGAQPFVVWSARYDRVSPHVNAGYQWNGASVLAGNPASGVSADFADQVTYVAGADVGINTRMTFAFDLLGRYVIDAKRLTVQQFHALDGVSTFSNIAFEDQSFSELNGAFGVKANVFGRLLLNMNLLFSLDTHGLRDRVTPLVGFDYSF